MDIPVLLEPTATGFRASTGAPLNLTAEAADKDAALKELRRQFRMLQIAGARVVSMNLPEPDPLWELTKKMSENPFLPEWDAATKEYRRQREAEEEAEDAAKEAAELASRNGQPHPQATEATTEPAA